MDPPLILWSIDKGARALEAYQQAEQFCVNVLADDQIELSNRFARQQQEKFAGVPYSLNEAGVPILEGCASSFECKTKAIYDGGDHLIILGEVVSFKTSDRSGLIFHNGGYAVSNEHPQLNVCA
jgi:flavin reductase (DIM6/NTAB) family NADH-FMN oxidoreductase RutF